MEEPSDGLHEKQKHGRRYVRSLVFGRGWTTPGCIDPNNKKYNNIILKEERKLKDICKNRILRRIFGPKRDENGEWRNFHNEELHSLYR